MYLLWWDMPICWSRIWFSFISSPTLSYLPDSIAVHACQMSQPVLQGFQRVSYWCPWTLYTCHKVWSRMLDSGVSNDKEKRSLCLYVLESSWFAVSHQPTKSADIAICTGSSFVNQPLWFDRKLAYFLSAGVFWKANIQWPPLQHMMAEDLRPMPGGLSEEMSTSIPIFFLFLFNRTCLMARYRIQNCLCFLFHLQVH